MASLGMLLFIITLVIFGILAWKCINYYEFNSDLRSKYLELKGKSSDSIDNKIETCDLIILVYMSNGIKYKVCARDIPNSSRGEFIERCFYNTKFNCWELVDGSRVCIFNKYVVSVEFLEASKSIVTEIKEEE